MQRGLFSIAFVVCWLTTSAILDAATPALSIILPRGGERGQTVDINFHGDRLSDTQEVLCYEPGLTIASWNVVNNNHVQAKLAIAADCAPGVKHFRIRTATGISDLRNFFVSPLPTVMEQEPNSDFAAPQRVAFGCTAEGVIDNEDVDFYVITAKAGDRITAELEAIRLGDSFFDAYVAILNSARFELSTSDDSALVHQDGVASVIAPADGDYIVQVREASYGGNGNCRYRCHIGQFPRPLGVVPGGAPAGSTVTVRYLGDVRGEFTRDVTIPADADNEFRLFPSDDFGIPGSGLKFRVNSLVNSLEQEPNDNLATASAAVIPGAFNGVLQTEKDEDWFKFTAKQGQTLDVQVWARRLRSELDSVLTMFNSGGGGLVGNDDQNGPDSGFRFTVPADGEYAVQIVDHLRRGGAAFPYRIEVEVVEPSLQLGVNEFVQYVEPKFAIPRGGHMPILINASRRDFGGPLEFWAENLPDGVTMQALPMPGDQNLTQVLFSATADAPLTGRLSRVYGKLTDPNRPTPLVGELTQPFVLIRGLNNIPFWTEHISRVPVAVTEALPFSLEIVTPKVPIVQNGQMQLKVRATRAEGFTAPIKIELVQNPPGINSSRDVSIPEGQTEAVIQLNAAGNAKVGEFPICLRADANVPSGPVSCASPFIPLRVAESYLKFEFQTAAVEQGKSTELVVNVEAVQPFEGNATVVLYGLPNKVTTAPLELNASLKELVFKVDAAMDAPPGQNKSLFCQAIVTEQGEPIIHNLGTGSLRVDQPLPMPVAAAPAPAPAPEPMPQPMPEAAPPPKRLTRLEQLRLEQKQRLEAQAAGKTN